MPDRDPAASGLSEPLRPKRPARADWLCLAVLVCSVGGLFAISAEVRRPWFETVSMRNSFSLIDTILVEACANANAWFREGPIALKFGTFDGPASVDRPTTRDRTMDAGYPTGHLVPLYLLARLKNAELATREVIWYSLCVQAGIAACLSFVVFLLLRLLGWRPLAAFVSAAIPVLLYLFLPLPFFLSTGYYWAETAVLLPYSVSLLLEVRRMRRGPGRFALWDCVQALVLLWGLFTEWLFGPYACVLFVIRLIEPGPFTFRRAFRHALLTLGPILCFLVGFIGRAWVADSLWYVERAFFEYSAVLEQPQSPWSIVTTALRTYYGSAGPPVFWGVVGVSILACLAYVIAKMRGARLSNEDYAAFAMPFLVVVPIAAHALILCRHLEKHSFDSTKFAIVFATVPFTLLPALLVHAVRRLWQTRRGPRPRRLLDPALVFASVMIILAAYWVSALMGPACHLFRHSPTRALQWIGEAVKRNTGPKDIVFLRGATWYTNYGTWAYSNRFINSYASLYDMAERTARCRGDYAITLLRLPLPFLLDLAPTISTSPGMPGINGFGVRELLAGRPAQVDRATGIEFYHVSSAEFRVVCDRLQVFPEQQRGSVANLLANGNLEMSGGRGIEPWSVTSDVDLRRASIGRPCLDCEHSVLSLANSGDTLRMSQDVSGLSGGSQYRLLGYVAGDIDLPCQIGLEVQSRPAGEVIAVSTPGLQSGEPSLSDCGLWVATDFRVPPSQNGVTVALVTANLPFPAVKRTIRCGSFQMFPIPADSMADCRPEPAQPLEDWGYMKRLLESDDPEGL